MGMATYISKKHQKPAWANGYENLSHCEACGAVFNNKTDFVRGYNVENGTMPSTFVPIGKCKQGCCPICDSPINE
jgi:hypothetical protein